jgi:hypothetical protein
MPFAVAAAGVAAAGTMYAANKQSKATKKAAQTAADAQAQAQEMMRADLEPWTTAGRNALAPTQDLLGLNGQTAADAAMAKFKVSPGYDFQMSEGLKAIDSGAAARGLLQSGATREAEQTFGQNLANQEFSTYYNRLMGMAQMGQNSAAQVGASGVQTAAGVAQTAASLGSAQASIYGNAASGIGSAVNQGIQNYQYQQRTNALAPQQSTYAQVPVYSDTTSGVY